MNDDIRTRWADPDMAEMERVAAELGKDGNLQAIDVSRRLRQCRGNRVRFKVPDLTRIEGVREGYAAVISEVGTSEMSLQDAAGVTKLFDGLRRTFIAVDHELKLRRMEQNLEVAQPPTDDE